MFCLVLLRQDKVETSCIYQDGSCMPINDTKCVLKVINNYNNQSYTEFSKYVDELLLGIAVKYDVPVEYLQKELHVDA